MGEEREERKVPKESKEVGERRAQLHIQRVSH